MHGPGRYEHGRQMTERQCSYQQSRHYLVADTQIQTAIEYGMSHADGSGLGDQVTREQRQLHAAFALGDAVAHRRDTGSELAGGTMPSECRGETIRVVLERRMSREHLVVAGDDGDMRRAALADDYSLILVLGCQGVRQIGTAESIAWWACQCVGKTFKVALARLRRACLQVAG